MALAVPAQQRSDLGGWLYTLRLRPVLRCRPDL